MVSIGILSNPQTIQLVGYQLVPGLVEIIHLIKELFSYKEPSKDPSKQPVVVNFLDTLQVLTNEGIDFTREKVFETPHPYP
jgi:hypothetical protein